MDSPREVRELHEALDARIEPWHISMPGCRGNCRQGRQPCMSPEDCAPDPDLVRVVFKDLVRIFLALAVIYLLAVPVVNGW